MADTALTDLAEAVEDALRDRRGDLRTTYVDLGIADLVGEFGLSPGSLVPVLRIAARELATGSLLEDAFVRPWLARRCGADLLGGDRLALVDPGATALWRPVRGSVEVRDGRLSGAVLGVPHASDADVLLVVADEETLVTVDAGGSVEAEEGLDPGTPIGRVSFDGVAGRVIPAPAGTVAGLRRWLRVLTAAELHGHCLAVLESAREHALRREQFGRPIGGFQAVRHLLADMATHTVALGHLIKRTAAELDELADAGAADAAAATKAYAGDTAVRVCEQGLQVLGGIGFVEEHLLHRHFKAALRLYGQHGTPAELRVELGRRATG